MRPRARRLDALIPAAGRSRRMGKPKLLLPFEGDTLLGHLVARLEEAGVTRVLLVVRPDDQDLRAWAAGRGLDVALNPEPERGMLTSVWSGLETLAAGRDLLLCPGDHPRVRPDTVRRLIEALDSGGAGLVLPVHNGQRGHPLLVAADLVPEIRRLDPQIGLRQLARRHADRLLELEVDDPGVLTDVDRPSDYARLLADPSS